MDVVSLPGRRADDDDDDDDEANDDANHDLEKSKGIAIGMVPITCRPQSVAVLEMQRVC